MKVFTRAEVAQNPDLVIIDGHVYNIGVFAKHHPGGVDVLRSRGGQDVTRDFRVYHNDAVLKERHDRLCVGRLDAREVAPRPDVPYADPMWYTRTPNSPYYTASHKAWRVRVRAFVDEHVLPSLRTWVDSPKGAPRDLQLRLGREGFLAALTGHAVEAARFLDADATPLPADFDPFHELILVDELARVAHSGAFSALTNGPAIALSAILAYGDEAMKRRVCPDVLMGRKNIALAITEPQAGSDVAGITTKAVKQGDAYIVTGSKKYITNGVYSHYFVTAVRTGAAGPTGLSFLLLEDGMPNFTRRKVAVRGADSGGTAYLSFEGVPVPAHHLIGKEGEGFKLVTHNFNHERIYIATSALRLSRVCVEESLLYAARREAFGKPLGELQSVRMHLANMALHVEMLQALLEAVVWQMKVLPRAEANALGDVIALLKAQASRCYEACARSTTMVLGGNALYADGVGARVEPAVAQVKAQQIPAGAEDVMMDYAGRVMLKKLAKL